MDTKPQPFVPPAPKPRTSPPSRLELARILYRNPLELWGEPSYMKPWVHMQGNIEDTLIVNDPGLVRHVLVDNVKNYRMGRLRQNVLKPLLREGLLTAEGETWKRSRKAMAPVFTPRHILGFSEMMLKRAETFAAKYADVTETDISRDMTVLTFEIMSDTLFSDEIAGNPETFERQVNRLLNTMGRVDPFDLLAFPAWLPRITRLRGRRSLAFFRQIVANTINERRARMVKDPDTVPEDFLTLLLRAEGPGGLDAAEVQDNIITFIGAGHETTARALGWTLYLLAEAPWERDRVEAEIDAVLSDPPPPDKWLEAMPYTRAAFEEALRLYPPAPSVSRAAIAADRYKDLEIRPDTTVLVMPWTLHRHRLLWEQPNAFMPERFWPENRDKIDRYQYLPFGAGQRICIGASFAMQEAVIALAVLLSRYRFDTTEATRPWPVQKLTTQPDHGLPMRVSRR